MGLGPHWRGVVISGFSQQLQGSLLHDKMAWQWGSSFLLAMGRHVPLVWGGRLLYSDPTACSLAVPSPLLAPALGVPVSSGGGRGSWFVDTWPPGPGPIGDHLSHFPRHGFWSLPSCCRAPSAGTPPQGSGVARWLSVRRGPGLGLRRPGPRHTARPVSGRNAMDVRPFADSVFSLPSSL